MAEYLIQGSTLTAIADSIRNKTGGTEAINPADMPSAIDVVASATLKSLLNGIITEVRVQGVESVRERFFSDCTQLIVIDLPDLKTMGKRSCYGCRSLRELNYPLLETIGEQAFYYCDKVTSVNFPLLTSLGPYAFQNCFGLVKADLGGVISIPTYAFRNCTKLDTLILRSNTVCELVDTIAISNTAIGTGKGYIYVPSTLIEDYKVATNWVTYADQFRAIEDYPEICGGIAA